MNALPAIRAQRCLRAGALAALLVVPIALPAQGADSARAWLRRGLVDAAERAARAAGDSTLTLLGDILKARGRLAEAESAWASAVRRSPDNLPAVVRLGVLRSERGDHDGARPYYDRLIAAYNASRGKLDADALAAVALACWQSGRDNPQLFKDALKAYDEALAGDPENVDVRVALGRLFTAKYNGTDAKATLDEALKIDDRHPDALIAAAERALNDNDEGVDSLVQRALAVNPEHVGARLMLARRLLDLERSDEARREASRALRANPASRAALAVLASIARVTNDQAEYERLRGQDRALNPRDAEFYTEVAEALARVRRYTEASDLEREAIAADARHWPAYSQLGLNLLRRGEIADGRRVLDSAFAGDPYDVRVKNTLDLLDTFKNYDTTATAHGVVMIEREESALLSVYLGALVDSAFATFSRRYGYVPQKPLRIEVYRSHADFSVRTLGFAGLAASGVAFGTTLAFDSPAAADIGAFNWGSTVWHEVAHTFTLGLTENRVPRWLSEGLSVFEEHRARPGWGASVSPTWLTAFRAGQLVPVSRMNDGFMRPAYPQQVPFSYVQAALVCEMIAAQWADSALVKMLHGFRDGRTTEQVFASVLGLSPRQLDARFDAYVRQRFASALAASAPPSAPSAPAMPKPDSRTRPAVDSLAVLRAEMLADETNLDAHLAVARLALMAHDTLTAVDALDRSMYINPMDVDRHRTLATLATATGRWPLAIRERRAIVAMAPVDLAGAWYELALAHWGAGNRAATRTAVLRALEEAPNYREAQDLLLTIVEGKP